MRVWQKRVIAEFASVTRAKRKTLSHEMGAAGHIEHKRYEGGHPLTQDRFDDIVHWLVERASALT
jgi:hypothetical protein